jgi:GNAT superfamily N-acetyltransferase
MTSALRFAPYDEGARARCLTLFDANCPEFFAPNERADYAAFLDRHGPDYTTCLVDGAIAGAFGVIAADLADRAHLNWILVDPAAQGAGLGRAIMAETRRRAEAAGRAWVDIAASHRSAPFFSRFGARELSRTPDGWGPGMHRVDMEWPL